MRRCWTYILANARRTVLYVGVTNNLPRRCMEHRAATRTTFTGRYHVVELVYFEEHPRPRDAIAREKQLKAGSRAAKERLISTFNPAWEDLFDPDEGVRAPPPRHCEGPKAPKQSGAGCTGTPPYGAAPIPCRAKKSSHRVRTCTQGAITRSAGGNPSRRSIP